MEKLSIDDIKHHETEKCFKCGIKLTTKNKSKWCSFEIVNGNQVAVDKCLWCTEISDRMLTSSRKINDKFIPQKTEKEIENEMIKENLTIKKLYIKEMIEEPATSEEIEKMLNG